MVILIEFICISQSYVSGIKRLSIPTVKYGFIYMKNKKFFLLYPPISKKERYSTEIGNAGGEQIPLGIYCLAAYIREKGYTVTVVDAEAENLTTEVIVEQIREFKPDYIGISSTTVAFHRALEVSKEIKSVFPESIIILGGPHVTSNAQHALSFKEFDFGVLGEGETTLMELLATIEDKGDLGKVKGIGYLDNGKLTLTHPRDYMKDLDSLPFPAYDLIKNIDFYTPPPSNYKALPVIAMITTRGCPNQCTFCDKNVFGTTYREISAEKVFEQIKSLYERYHFKEIAFVDDTFMINRKRLFRLFELLDQENIHFYWTCMSRVNIVDLEFLKYIKSKGCWHISFGIESGNRDILKLIKKNITLEQIKNAINWCHQVGIKTKGFFIIGHPSDTLETIDATIKFACSLKLDDIVTTINTPIPGSPQYAFIKEYGHFDETDWSQFNYWRPVFVPAGLTQEILLKKHQEIYRRFYLRPRILWRYFMGFFGQGGLKRFMSVFKASRFLIEKN
jgi:anaerobic magnesium-protoporphyrin IX monomethyl ester cyclase